MRRFNAFIIILVACSLFTLESFALVPSAQPVDDWVAYPLHVASLAEPAAISSYSPNQIRAAYGLPSSGGAEVTIAIIVAFDAPTIWNDLEVFSNQFGLPPPTENNFEVRKMAPNIEADTGWGEETALDVEWAHAIAPDAKILLVQARSNSRGDLLAAIDYARNRPDVVAISMSWGGDEPSNPALFNARLVSSYGAVFFAASGDDGAGVMWPSSSANVVAVGGTTLNLNVDGTVISETGWSGSGGGLSAYEPLPAYQANYGLSTSKRAVPDVSYNANPQTGVAVYFNSSWYKVGGTSAGAPQWAAIHALGRSASNGYLYDKAKSAYSSYFRDITSGSNGYSASAGYDYVTGLGSPLTANFASEFSVSPAFGPPGSSVSLQGSGFSVSSTVSLSYLNPLTSIWVPIEVNVPTTSTGQFSYSLTVPDLMQGNPAGDNQPLSSDIIFKAQDNLSGFSYNATTPYTEWYRGLTQAGTVTANGLFGNNTNFGSTVLAQVGQALAVSGKWFNPGTVNLLFDGTTNVGSTTADASGSFSTSITVPESAPAGLHNIVVADSNANFVFTIRRLPVLTADYDGAWHTSDFAVPLSADGDDLSDLYYRVNNGPVQSVHTAGQPFISTENRNNVLEYWGVLSTDTGNLELSHSILTGIKLDKTNPEGSITINSGQAFTTSASVLLSLTATDLVSGVSQVRFSNDGIWDTEPWEGFFSSKSWILTFGDGAKTVYFQIIDYAGLSSAYSAGISLDTNPPQGSMLINNAAAFSNDTDVNLGLSATDSGSGIALMRFSNDDSVWSEWEGYISSKNWSLQHGDGVKKVTVQYKDKVGLISTYNSSITVDTTAPIANAGWNQTVTRGTSVNFNGNESYDINGVTSYVWDFGDGSQGSGVSTSHVYSTEGTFTAKLTVFDQAQNSATAAVAIIVEPPPTPSPPAQAIAPVYLMAILGTIFALVIGLTVVLRRKINRLKR